MFDARRFVSTSYFLFTCLVLSGASCMLANNSGTYLVGDNINSDALLLVESVFPDTGLSFPVTQGGPVYKSVNRVGLCNGSEGQITVIRVFRVIPSMLSPRGMTDVCMFDESGNIIGHIYNVDHESKTYVDGNGKFVIEPLIPIELDVRTVGAFFQDVSHVALYCDEKYAKLQKLPLQTENASE